MEVVEQVRNQREWVSVLLGDVIEATIIHSKAERAVLFLDEEDGCAGR